MKHDRQLATLAILLLAFALAACGQSGSGSESAPADDASATDAARPLPEGAQAFSLFGEPLHPNPAPPEIASQQAEDIAVARADYEAEIARMEAG
jgi:predicted small lipoprotein YifL